MCFKYEQRAENNLIHYKKTYKVLEIYIQTQINVLDYFWCIEVQNSKPIFIPKILFI